MRKMNLASKDVLLRAQQRGYDPESIRGCILEDRGGRWIVDVDHPAYPRDRGQPIPPPQAPSEKLMPRSGPGTELKTLLAVMGIHASPTCKCNKMARQMNLWGAEESLNHIEDIVDVMEETAKVRGLPFLRMAGKTLVKLACRRARQKAAQKDTNQ